MMKRLIIMVLAVAMVFGLTGQVEKANADKGYDAVLTIDANKHRFGNFATLEIGMSYYEGYWNDDQKVFMVVGSGKYAGEVENGQIIGSGSERVLIKTIAKKEEPKPQPKKEQKPQPKKESNPKQQQAKPKQESNPKQQSQQKQQPKQESKPKQQVQSTQQTSQSKQVEKTEAKKDEKPKAEKSKTESKKEDEEKEKKLTVAELKSKNAEVVKEGSKFYAVYKGDEGKEVKQEVSEEEAKELGYEEEVKTVETVKEETSVEEKEDDKKSSKVGIIAGTTAVALAGLGGGGYFIFRRFM